MTLSTNQGQIGCVLFGKMKIFLTCSPELTLLFRFLAVSHINIAHPGNMREELGRLLAVESR